MTHALNALANPSSRRRSGVIRLAALAGLTLLGATANAQVALPPLPQDQGPMTGPIDPERGIGLQITKEVTLPPLTIPEQPAGFTGRYRWGPEAASVRVVMFSGYQCPDCKVAEQQVRAVLAVRGDVSLSIKQFPLSSRCNKYMQGQNPHPFGCMAARVAEAAGMLAGDRGFRSISDWLYATGGDFQEAELDAAVMALGVKPTDLKAVLQNQEMSAKIDAFIAADIDEGVALGLTQTPMIFVNGTELRDWRSSPSALRDAIIRIAATNPPTQTAQFDKPPTAADKHLTDWRRLTPMVWPDRVKNWPSPVAVPPADAPVDIQVWSDVLEPNTATLDRLIRETLAKRPADAPAVRYTIRPFPVDQSCNPDLPRTAFPGGCLAAKTIEAAGRLGGEDAASKAQAWILANQGKFNAQAVAGELATAVGIPGPALLATAQNPELDRALGDEIARGKSIGIPLVPRLFINGRPLVGWDLPADAGGKGVLERAIEAAATLPRQ